MYEFDINARPLEVQSNSNLGVVVHLISVFQTHPTTAN